MKFSVYYRILHRDTYFKRFFKRERNKYVNEEDRIIAEEMFRDMLETIVSYVFTENRLALATMLTKSNSKIARRFFDYLTQSDTVHSSRAVTVEKINKFFDEVITDEDYSRILARKAKASKV